MCTFYTPQHQTLMAHQILGFSLQANTDFVGTDFDQSLACLPVFSLMKITVSRQTDNITLSAINITTQRHKKFVKSFDYHYPALSFKGLTERVIVQTKN